MVRQGDPLSPYIFLICVEFLGCLIRKNKNIGGITIENVDCKITQYADDSTVILDGSDKSLIETLNTLDLFERLSGLKINEDKTNVIYIGSLRNKKSIPNLTNKKLNWVKDGKFSALGVDFTIKVDEMVELNYYRVMESVTKLMKHWSKRNLTVFGRITVVKSILIPKFNHLVLSIPNPSKDFVKTLKKHIYEFIWKGKTDKISRDQLSNDYPDGGLRLVQVDLFFEALKCTWIRRILNGNIDNKGFILFSKLTGMNIDDLEKGASYTLRVASKVKNAFWREVLVSWSKIKSKHVPVVLDDILKSCLWNNEHFKIGGKEFNYKKWRVAGIVFVTDLIHAYENRFLFWNEIEARYGFRTNYLEYNSVINAIKNNFKHIFQANVHVASISRPFIPFHFSLILRDKKGCKSLCNQLLDTIVPKAKQKWSDKMGLQFSDQEWKAYNLIPFKCTIDVKLRWFQYRVLNRILTTNTCMYNIGQRNSLCTFYNDESETIKHLFTECKKVKPILAQLQTWIYQKLDIPIILDQKHSLWN